MYGALAYNGEKINEAKGRLLATNRIYNDGTGMVNIGKAMEGFMTFMPPVVKTQEPRAAYFPESAPGRCIDGYRVAGHRKGVSGKMGYGNQPYLTFKHEDIDRHHLHIVTVNVGEDGKRINQDYLFRRSERVRKELEQKYGLYPAGT